MKTLIDYIGSLEHVEKSAFLIRRILQYFFCEIKTGKMLRWAINNQVSYGENISIVSADVQDKIPEDMSRVAGVLSTALFP